ncbi:MAG: heavy-metal-associated domain-containing protein [Bacteroidales bacterium]|nr:heavy-metal-associated domain-containing protein [Bacteroidales bacterium]
MKQIFIFILAALLLASPIAIAGNIGTVSALQDKKAKKEKKTVTYNVSMHCKNCVAKITDNVSFVKGVEDLKVSLDEKIVTITYDPAKTDEATLQKAIEKLGYTAEKVNPDDKR